MSNYQPTDRLEAEDRYLELMIRANDAYVAGDRKRAARLADEADQQFEDVEGTA